MLDYDEYMKAMEDIRNKWQKAEKLVINYDPKSVFLLSEIDVLDFADTCICHKGGRCL